MDPLPAPDPAPDDTAAARPGVGLVLAIAVLGGGALGLLGATGFGLVHVVGGELRANPRAVTFGVELAAAAGSAAALDGWLLSRLLRRRSAS